MKRHIIWIDLVEGECSSEPFYNFYHILFRRKSQAVVIARLLLSYKNYNVAHYSKNIKGINTKLAHHDKVHLQDKGHNSESYSFGVMPHDYLEILSKLHSKYNNLKTIKDINMKLWIIAYHDMGQL